MSRPANRQSASVRRSARQHLQQLGYALADSGPAGAADAPALLAHVLEYPGSEAAYSEALRTLLDADAEAVGMKQAQTRLLLTVEYYVRGDVPEQRSGPERLQRAMQAAALFLLPDAGKARAAGLAGRSRATRSLTPQAIQHGMAVLFLAVTSATDCQLHSLRILTDLTKVCLHTKFLRSQQLVAKELLPYWSQLLPSSAASAAENSSFLFALVRSGASTDIRCAACALLEHIFCDAQGYWAMAQESKRAMAFTTHSERLAGVLLGTRQELVALLDEVPKKTPSDDPAVHIAVLSVRSTAFFFTDTHPTQLVQTFVCSTQAASLLQPHQTVLLAPLCRCATDTAQLPSVRVHAYACLGAVLTTAPSSLPRTGGIDVCAATAWLLATVQEQPKPSVRSQAWRALAVLLPVDPAVQNTRSNDVLVAVKETLTTDRYASGECEEVRCEAMSTVPAVLSTDAHEPTGAPAELAAVLELGAADAAGGVRTRLCEALPGAYIWGADRAYFAALDTLLSDADANVRAAAARSIGVLMEAVQTQPDVRVAVQAHFPYDTVATVLLGEQRTGLFTSHALASDASHLVRVRAAWSLANWTALEKLQLEAWKQLLPHVLRLSCDDERVAVHGIRALGTMLGEMHAAWLADDDGTAQLTAGVAALHTVLRQARNPKLRWNAASSVSKVAEQAPTWLAHGRGQALQQALDEVVQALVLALGDRVFKVKLLAAQGLLALLVETENGAPRLPITPATLSHLHGATAAAHARIDSELADATFAEAKLHGHASRELMAKLHKALTLYPST